MAHVIDHDDHRGRAVLVPNHASLHFVNPNFIHNHHRQVLVPVRFAPNPAVLARIELEKSISLQQVGNLILFLFVFLDCLLLDIF